LSGLPWLPGVVAVLNEQAVTFAVQAGCLELHHSSKKSIFARKNYFYPDLPKAIRSVNSRNRSRRMATSISTSMASVSAWASPARTWKKTGKNVHGIAGDSQVDLNRAGTPLCEIVGEPDLCSAAEAPHICAPCATSGVRRP